MPPSYGFIEHVHRIVCQTCNQITRYPDSVSNITQDEGMAMDITEVAISPNTVFAVRCPSAHEVVFRISSSARFHRQLNAPMPGTVSNWTTIKSI
jgi:hypothetical protein